MTYKLKSLDVSTTNWPDSLMLFRDGDDSSNKPTSKTALRAQVASNDYFALLATRLDQISRSLKASQHSDHIVLEAVICDLLYLQDHYCITEK